MAEDLGLVDLLNGVLEHMTTATANAGIVDMEALRAEITSMIEKIAAAKLTGDAAAVRGKRVGAVDTFRLGASTWTFDRTSGKLAIRKEA